MELVVSDKSRLAELEVVIKDGLTTFIDVGAALLEIRNSRLYRHEHRTFEEYCRIKWGMGKDYSNRLIKAYEVTSNIGNDDNCHQIPSSESHVRPLTKLEPGEQRAAWDLAVRIAKSEKRELIAKDVENAVKKLTRQENEELKKEETDSDNLFNMKYYWRKSTKKERRLFVDWIKNN